MGIFIMAEGVDNCRFGFYTQQQLEILTGAGLKYRIIASESAKNGIWHALKRAKSVAGPVSWWSVLAGVYLAYQRSCLLDRLEKTLQWVRCQESAPGIADKIFRYALLTMAEAATAVELEEAFSLANQKLQHVPGDEEFLQA